MPVEAQGELKQAALGIVEKRLALSIDGQSVKPVFARADFLTLGATGAIIRQAPEPERVDSAILGLTFAYESAGPPQQLELAADLFSAVVESLPVTLADPSGSQQQELTADTATLQWENRLLDFRLPEIRAVAVTRPALPILSIALVLIAVGTRLLWRRPAALQRRSS